MSHPPTSERRSTATVGDETRPMTVADASIVVRFLLNRPGDDALRVRFARERRLAAPHLIDAEVTAAVRGLLLARGGYVGLDRARAAQMLADYGDMAIDRFPMRALAARVLALRDNFTAYDAFYLALAEALDEPLLTDDAKFARAPQGAVVIETWT